MNCLKCGNELQEDAKFCPKCGQPVETEAKPAQEEADKAAQSVSDKADASAKEQANKTEQPAQGNSAKTQQNAKSSTSGNGGSDQGMLTKVIVGVAAAAAVLIIGMIGLVAIVLNHKVKINLNKYVTVTTEGYDTLGTAYYSIDFDKMEDDYGDKVKINYKKLREKLKEEGLSDKVDKEDIDRMVKLYGGVFDMMTSSAIKGSLDKSRGLSNGDEISFEWNIDDEVLECFNVKLVYKDLAVKVEDLEKVDTFNPFDFVEVSYTGISPNGNVYIDKASTPEYMQYVSITPSANGDLANGDTIVLTASINGTDDAFISRFGKYPGVTSQEYTVDGLLAYVESNDQISDELTSKMRAQAEDALAAYAARSWSVNLTEMTYLGNYLLTKKKGVNFWGNQNANYLVYKVRATADLETPSGDKVAYEKEYYYYAAFSNLMLDENGVCEVDLNTHTTPYDSFTDQTNIPKYKYSSGGYSFTYKGYETLDQLYSAVVTKNLENYAHEDNVSDTE